MTMKMKNKPFLSIFEDNLEDSLAIDGRTITKTMEDSDIDNFEIILNGSTSTRTIEDSDYDNSVLESILDD